MARLDAQAKKLQARQQRRDLARLKSRGLYSGDARKKPTAYGKSLLKKFADVLGGRAAPVKTGSKIAKAYKEAGFQTRREKVIIPKKPKDRVVFSKKSGRISRTTRTATGEKSKQIIEPIGKSGDIRALPKARKGKQTFYAVPFGSAKNQYIVRFSSFEELQTFMQPYERKERNPYLDWQKYVFIEELDSKAARSVSMEDDDDYGED